MATLLPFTCLATLAQILVTTLVSPPLPSNDGGGQVEKKAWRLELQYYNAHRAPAKLSRFLDTQFFFLRGGGMEKGIKTKTISQSSHQGWVIVHYMAGWSSAVRVKKSKYQLS